jgi:hypothetical protein
VFFYSHKGRQFPWHATAFYTVEDRNGIFKSVNRQVTALVSKIRKTKTVGLDLKLLKDLLQAAYRCPAFNDRQKFTLALNSQDQNEISKFPDVARYWPFDTLVMKSNTPMTILLVCEPSFLLLHSCLLDEGFRILLTALT